MAQEAKVSILITAKNAAKTTLSAVEAQFSTLKRAVTSLKGQLAGFGVALTGAGILKWLTSVNSEYGRLLTQLRTFDGDARAPEIFRQLAQFAAVTPFQIDEVVQAYITLRSAGIAPTLESMQRFGDQASAMGRPIQDFAIAIRAATTGEFEPLKSFGVQMRVNGDKVIASFQGVTTVIGRDAQSITHYLETLSATHFAGGMERESRTLGGALSNLQDSAASLAREIGDAGLTKDVTNLARSMDQFLNSAGGVEDLTVKYLAFKGVILTIVDSLRLVARLFVTPIVMVAQFVRDMIAGLDAFVAHVVLPVAMIYDRVTGKNTAAGVEAFRSRSLSQFLSGSAIKTFVGLGEDFGESFARASLRDEELQAARERRDRARAAGTKPAAGLRATGLASASGTSGAAGDRDPEAKARRQEIDDLETQMDLQRQLIEMNEQRGAALVRLAELEDRARAMLQQGNLTVRDRLDLLKVVASSQDVRKAFGLLNGAEITKALDPQKGSLKPQLALPGAQLPPPKAAVVPRAEELSFAQRLGLEIRDTFAEGKRLDALIADMTATTLQDFGSAIEDAFAAFADGSANAAQAFESAMLGAIASVAEGFGRYALGRATAAVGEGLLGNPGAFAAAAQWTAAAAALFAVAGTLKGAAHVAAGGGSRASSAATSRSLSDAADKGEASLVIEGGFLDMNDPRQADALAAAIGALSGRRVTIKGRR